MRNNKSSVYTLSKIQLVLQEHYLYAIVLVVIVITRLPLLANLHELVLLNQDTNPEHFGRLFFDHDMPVEDDSEVGENSRTFSLASLYFSLPLLFFRFGIPFDFFAGLHALFVLPIISYGIYRLAIEIHGEKRIACLAVLIFLFRDFLVFRLNLGYPLVLNQMIYYSDANVIFILFALIAMIRVRLITAACWIGLLVLCNPTAIGTISTCLVLFLYLSRRESLPSHRQIFISFLVLVGAAGAAFIAVLAATPIRNPAPEAARILSIQLNAHFAPHIESPIRFLFAQFVFVAILIYAIFVETSRQRKGASQANAFLAPLHLSYAMFAAYVCCGWIAYWTLYIFWPVVFVMFAPAKSFMICSIYICIYVAHALYLFWSRWATSTVVVLGFVILFFQPENVGYPTYRPILFTMLLVISGIDVVARERTGLINRWRIDVGFSVLLLVMICDFLQHSTQVFRSGQLNTASAFYDIQLEIKNKISPQAIFVPYRIVGAVRNQYGPFGNWPFRTYSRRGANAFWLTGRNIYYNSALRHQLEVQSYAAFGIDYWDDLLRESEKVKKADPLFYYTGLQVVDGKLMLKSTPMWSYSFRSWDKLVSMVSTMSLAEFMQVAARLGATHVIVSRDPGQASQIVSGIQNDYFVVLSVN